MTVQLPIVLIHMVCPQIHVFTAHRSRWSTDNSLRIRLTWCLTPWPRLLLPSKRNAPLTPINAVTRLPVSVVARRARSKVELLPHPVCNRSTACAPVLKKSKILVKSSIIAPASTVSEERIQISIIIRHPVTARVKSLATATSLIFAVVSEMSDQTRRLVPKQIQ